MTNPELSRLEKIGEGREAEIYRWDEARVLRLMRDARARDRLDREVVALRAAYGGGAPVPFVGETVMIDGRPGLVMERIDGPDFIRIAGRQPWLITRLARRLGEIHQLVNRIQAPPDLPDTRSLLERKIISAPGLSAVAREIARRALDGLPDGDRLSHGDFHPGNVLTARGEAFVIDWTNASCGDADADVARTLLMLEIAVVPDSSPLIVRRLSAVGRGYFKKAYIRGYTRSRALGSGIERWKLAHAAARCAEGIVEEAPVLVEYLERSVHEHPR